MKDNILEEEGTRIEEMNDTITSLDHDFGTVNDKLKDTHKS
ncbi:MAG: hypothetical protein ACKPKO_19595 [Candidatus Fonsibacter sp.]